MKKIIFTLILSLFSFILPNQWIDISSSEEEVPSISIVSSDIENTIVEFNLSGFNQKSVFINDDEYLIVSFPNSASNLELGYPNLPSISKSIIIPNNGLMKTEIIGAEYIEYDNILIAPSKGNISREINPSSINYFFNDIYLRYKDLLNEGDILFVSGKPEENSDRGNIKMLADKFVCVIM